VEGNSAKTTITVNIDKTNPTLQAQLQPLPNLAGWSNQDTRVLFLGKTVCQE
jgi:hypothetical protein